MPFMRIVICLIYISIDKAQDSYERLLDQNLNQEQFKIQVPSKNLF